MQIVSFPMGRLNYFALDIKKVMVFNTDQFVFIHTMFGLALVIISGKKGQFCSDFAWGFTDPFKVYY